MSASNKETEKNNFSAFRRSRDKIGSILGAESPRGRVMITAANRLTLIRLVVVPLFWYGFLSDSPLLRVSATILFIGGALTDLYDGKLARKRSEETAFGNFMDPLADKLLVLSAYWALMIREDFNGLFILALVWISLITLREIGLTLMRIFAVSGGSSLVTSIWGKWKTGVQLTTLIFTLLALNLRDFLIIYEYSSSLFKGTGFFILVNILLFLCASTSLISGGIYLKEASNLWSRSD